jgi:hypothetical protein
VVVNDVPRTIVGIMPKHFAYPGDHVELWLPLARDPANRRTFDLVGIARLKRGVSRCAQPTSRASSTQLAGTSAQLHLAPQVESLGPDRRPCRTLLWLVRRRGPRASGGLCQRGRPLSCAPSYAVGLAVRGFRFRSRGCSPDPGRIAAARRRGRSAGVWLAAMATSAANRWHGVLSAAPGRGPADTRPVICPRLRSAP